MGSRREDEKNEATIRRLLKLPENKRCINCNSLGPQYVCTNFATFVCTQCSGIHREFSHRIKSISMAKFTAAEVASLQAGGNERARQVFFRSMDSDRMYRPDSGSLEKLREFINLVYEKRLYTGERPRAVQQEETTVELRRPDLKVEQQPNIQRLSLDDHFAVKDSVNKLKSGTSRSSVDNRSSPKHVDSSQAVPRPTRASYDEEKSPESKAVRDRGHSSRPFRLRDFDITPPPAQSITDILGDIPGLRIEVYKASKGEHSPDHSKGSSVDARNAMQSQSFGAVGNDKMTPAPDFERVDSASLIDMNSETEATAVSRGMDDPLIETSQVSQSISDSWDMFNISSSSPARPGHPASKSESSQLVDCGWGQQPSSLDSWSSFGTPSPSQAASEQEHSNATPLSVSQNTSGVAQPQRQRRELPKEFFAPSFEDVRQVNLDMHRPHQMQPPSRPPQLDAPFESFYNMPPSTSSRIQDLSQFQFSHQTQLLPVESSQQMHSQPPTSTQRSRNPFDDDFEDDSSSSVTSSATTGFSMQFPNMDSLRAALSPEMSTSTEVSTTGNVPQNLSTNAASNGFGYSIPQLHDNFSPSGAFNFGPNQSSSTFQMPSEQTNSSGGFASTHIFGQDGPYPSNQFHSQNIVRPAGGGNPFG